MNATAPGKSGANEGAIGEHTPSAPLRKPSAATAPVHVGGRGMGPLPVGYSTTAVADTPCVHAVSASGYATATSVHAFMKAVRLPPGLERLSVPPAPVPGSRVAGSVHAASS